jgi:hypothetical protein
VHDALLFQKFVEFIELSQINSVPKNVVADADDIEIHKILNEFPPGNQT